MRSVAILLVASMSVVFQIHLVVSSRGTEILPREPGRKIRHSAERTIIKAYVNSILRTFNVASEYKMSEEEIASEVKAQLESFRGTMDLERKRSYVSFLLGWPLVLHFLSLVVVLWFYCRSLLAADWVEQKQFWCLAGTTLCLALCIWNVYALRLLISTS